MYIFFPLAIVLSVLQFSVSNYTILVFSNLSSGLFSLPYHWNIDNFFPISIICNIYQSLQLTVVVKILSKIFFYLYRHEYTEKHIHFPVCYLCKRNKQFIWNSYMNIHAQCCYTAETLSNNMWNAIKMFLQRLFYWQSLWVTANASVKLYSKTISKWLKIYKSHRYIFLVIYQLCRVGTNVL